MNPSQVPDGWNVVLVSEACDQISTAGKKVQSKDCKADGLFPVVDQGQTAVSGYVDDESAVIRSRKPVVVFGDHTRTVKWVDFDFVPGADGTKLLVAADFVNPRFFCHQLRSIELPDKGYARHFQFLRESTFFVPPLAEQRQIAAKLDELLAQVDTLKARLDAIPAILKRFRKSVLAAATAGRLTDDWRNSAQSVAKHAADWKSAKLSELGSLERGRSKHRPRNDPRLFGSEYPFIQTGDVANSAGKVMSARQRYSAFGLRQSRLFPKGTLCITIAANIADTAILGIDACFPDSVVGFRARESTSINPFAKLLIDRHKSDLEALAPATAQKNINLKVLEELCVALPPLDEQMEIVRRVDQLFAFTDQIEQRVKAAQARVNHLTQSILAKAFRGELTAEWRAQNPHLISGENSAEALLARIRATREAEGGTGAGRRARKARAVVSS